MAFDRALVNFIQACDLFLAPHTGFGLAALAVWPAPVS